MPATLKVPVDERVLRKAEEVLRRRGFTTAEVINIVILRIAEDEELPFNVETPNAETKQARLTAAAWRGAT